MFVERAANLAWTLLSNAQLLGGPKRLIVTELPLDVHIPAILEAIAARRSLVLSAPPGSGKTTRLAPALVKSGLIKKNESVALLQPRRIAARSIAARIAIEQGWALGEEVGYQVRHESVVSHRTRLKVLTEGVLNRQAVADPFLEGLGAVILDEFHERSIHTDLALALVGEARKTVREDLIVIVMSATLDCDTISKHLADCPVIRVETRNYPVEIEYRELPFKRIEDQATAVLEEVLRAGAAGDVLVFLPGAGEIERVQRRIEMAAAASKYVVLPLHGKLSADKQDMALKPSPRGLGKIVLATNIAETSLTIDGIRTVVDTGKARVASIDQARGLDKLELESISRASADQRAGRAGRTGPGRCIRLWPERVHRLLAEHDRPEIQRVDLSAAMLSVHAAFGVRDPREIAWFEQPPEESLAGAERLLEMLGALEGDSKKLTHLGARMAGLPVHPRIARLLIEASDRGFSRAGATLAAILSEPDFLTKGKPGTGRPRAGDRGSSDVLVRIDTFEYARSINFSRSLLDLGVDPARARAVEQTRRVLERIVRDASRSGAPEREPEEEDLLELVLFAYPDRLARRRGPRGDAAVMVGGGGVRLGPESVVRDSELFLALDPRQNDRSNALEAWVSIASAIALESLEALLPGTLRRSVEIRFDEQKRKVVGLAVLRYHDLVLKEDQGVAVDALAAGELLAQSLEGGRGSDWILEDPAAKAWLDRLAWLVSALPELELPDIGPAVFSEILRSACAGKSSEQEARNTPLVPILERLLTHSQLEAMRRHAPDRMTLPNGRQTKIVYSEDRPPTVSARVQDLFGWTETPRIAAGRTPLLLEILAPNQRPVQLTSDLAGFWSNTYFQVRKDLRGRYPKHAWPEDPKNAKPIVKKT